MQTAKGDGVSTSHCDCLQTECTGQSVCQFWGVFGNSKISWHILCLCKNGLVDERKNIPRLPGRGTARDVWHGCSQDCACDW